VEKTPKFIREFSKEESPEERKQVAQAIRAERRENFAYKQDLEAKQNELQNTANNEHFLIEELNKLDKLENEISEIALSKTEKMLNDFYENQKNKWVNSEYKKDEITKYFSESNLSSLSLEEYILLLKKFPSEMVAHVTRQGIRDHIGHSYHTAGMGAYSSGFMKMLKDGCLKSPLGVYLVEKEKEKAIAKFFHLDLLEDKNEAMENFNRFFNIEGGAGSGNYLDRTAIHFAAEEVADTYYGSEKSNEIFIVYPSAFIASQYYFKGNLKAGDEGQHNDQYVWANEEKGMNLNAGIIFIPKDTKVDKKTGSRYEIDESGNPIENIEFLNRIKEVVDSNDFHNFVEQVRIISSPYLGEETEKKLEPYRKRLGNEFNVTDYRLQQVFLGEHNNLWNLDFKKKCQEEKKDLPDEYHFLPLEKEILQNEGILYQEAIDTINSKEFWEIYFKKNAEIKPSKIVYYKEDSPTRALSEWKDKSGLWKKGNDSSIGFQEHQLYYNKADNKTLVTSGMNRFKDLAEKVIEDYYNHKKVLK